QLRPPRVAEDQAPLQVEEEDRVGDVLRDEPVPLFRLPEGPGEPLLLERLVERRHQLAHVERLGEVPKGRAVDRLHGGGEGGVTGDENHLGLGGRRLDRLEEVEPRGVGKLQIDDGGLDRTRGQGFEAGAAAVGRPHNMALELQDVPERLARSRVVINNEDQAARTYEALPASRPHRVPVAVTAVHCRRVTQSSAPTLLVSWPADSAQSGDSPWSDPGKSLTARQNAECFDPLIVPVWTASRATPGRWCRCWPGIRRVRGREARGRDH